MDFKPGDQITILVDRRPFMTYIDEHNVQRFYHNEVVCFLFDSGKLDLNQLSIDHQQGKFSKDHYMKFYMELGYSVCGFCDVFDGLEILNPVWESED